MGMIPSSCNEPEKDITIITRTLYECPQEFIMVEDGKLVFGRSDHPEVKVSRGFLGGHIHVGCHTLTKEAWELLKKKVDGAPILSLRS